MSPYNCIDIPLIIHFQHLVPPWSINQRILTFEISVKISDEKDTDKDKENKNEIAKNFYL